MTDFAEDIIDISVVDHLDPGLEQQEVNEKIVLYTQKLDESASRIVRDNTSSVPTLDNLSIKQIVEQLKTVEIRWVMFNVENKRNLSPNPPKSSQNHK